jgi:alginate O-acetyltransferase complex protein AlgI
MLFNSTAFVVFFFPIVTTIYFLLRHQYRWAWLVLASCYFYMAFVPKYILILFFLILVDYFAGLLIEKSQGTKRKTYLIASLVANLSILGFYKYFNFVNTNVHWLADAFGWKYSIPNLSIILPIGLSFHTFQSMSYTIEVYLGNYKAERHLGIYALYVLFYPQLVAGPIERPQNLLHQFREKHSFDFERVVDGLKLMIAGFIKKVIIADRLAYAVDPVFEHPAHFTGTSLWIAAYFFAFQIYCDFSAYTDIARGAARVMGFELMENFNQPYFARSIPDYWRRWHISLFSWFRDYLYTPIALSGNKSMAKIYLALFIVFLVSGVWHGAGWTFIVWGALHGIYQVCSLFTLKYRKRLAKKMNLARFPRLHAAWGIFITFHLVTFALIFFRAEKISDAWYIITHLFQGVNLHGPWESYGILTIGFAEFLMSISFIGALLWLDRLSQTRPISVRIANQPIWLRWSLYYLAVLAIFFLAKNRTQEFIYFQF